MKNRSPELQERIDNRETELQMAYDDCKEELEFLKDDIALLQKKIQACNMRLTKIILRAYEQDAIDILIE